MVSFLSTCNKLHFITLLTRSLIKDFKIYFKRTLTLNTNTK